MCAINFKSERGALLVTVIVFIVFVSVLGLVVGTLTTSENKMQLVQGEEQKALYAAQSGLEYGIKQVLSADTLSDWTEDNINVNDQTTVKVQVEQTDPTTIVVRAWGKSHRYVKELETTLADMDTSDVSKYAIYSAGQVSNAVTVDSLSASHRQGLIYQNAKVMPQFDLDALRAAAQESGTYYEGDLVVNNSFSPPDNAIVFVEGKTRFVKGNWSGNVHFVSNGDVVFNPSWKNSAPVHMTIYQPEAGAQLYIQPSQGEDGGDDGDENDNEDDGNSDNHGVDFEIQNDNVVPSETFAAKATVLGAAISSSGNYDLPVTVKFKIDGDKYKPFGPFNKAVSGNVNDGQNPRDYIFPNLYPGGSAIKVVGRSWDKKSWWDDGSNNNDWKELMTVNSENGSQNVITLRDGDAVPNIQGFMNQSSIEDFVAPYINSETNRITLNNNQSIYLFELGTTDLNSPAADFQDLVVLMTLAKDQEQLAQSNNDGGGSGGNGTNLLFYGGIITNGSVSGQFSSESSGEEEDDHEDEHEDDDHEDDQYGENEDHGEDEHEDHSDDEQNQSNEVKQLVVVHDKQILRDFLKYSVNGGPRVLQAATWKSIN